MPNQTRANPFRSVPVPGHNNVLVHQPPAHAPVLRQPIPKPRPILHYPKTVNPTKSNQIKLISAPAKPQQTAVGAGFPPNRVFSALLGKPEPRFLHATQPPRSLRVHSAVFAPKNRSKPPLFFQKFNRIKQNSTLFWGGGMARQLPCWGCRWRGLHPAGELPARAIDFASKPLQIHENQANSRQVETTHSGAIMLARPGLQLPAPARQNLPPLGAGHRFDLPICKIGLISNSPVR